MESLERSCVHREDRGEPANLARLYLDRAIEHRPDDLLRTWRRGQRAEVAEISPVSRQVLQNLPSMHGFYPVHYHGDCFPVTLLMVCPITPDRAEAVITYPRYGK